VSGGHLRTRFRYVSNAGDGSLWARLSRILCLVSVPCGVIQRPVWPEILANENIRPGHPSATPSRRAKKDLTGISVGANPRWVPRPVRSAPHFGIDHPAPAPDRLTRSCFHTLSIVGCLLGPPPFVRCRATIPRRAPVPDPVCVPAQAPLSGRRRARESGLPYRGAPVKRFFLRFSAGNPTLAGVQAESSYSLEICCEPAPPWGLRVGVGIQRAVVIGIQLPVPCW